MKNWTVDEKQLKKHFRKYQIWQLEQQINYGLDEERLNRQNLLKYFHDLKIDSQKKKYLKFLLRSK